MAKGSLFKLIFFIAISLTVRHGATAENSANTSDSSSRNPVPSVVAGGGGGDSSSSFELTATAKDFALYFPAYLANGYFTTMTSIRGTDAALSLMAGLMDYTAGDVSRPAAIPSWAEINYFDSKSLLNDAAITPETLRGYRQTLRMKDGLLTTHVFLGQRFMGFPRDAAASSRSG